MDEITIFLTQYVGYPLGTRVRSAAAEALKGWRNIRGAAYEQACP